MPVPLTMLFITQKKETEMEPVVNPRFFYWVMVCDNAVILFAVLGGIGLVA